MFNNILSQPAIFIGLIVVIGYILLKRKWYEIAAGFIKAVVGYQILQLGASSLKNTVDPLLKGIQLKWSELWTDGGKQRFREHRGYDFFCNDHAFDCVSLEYPAGVFP